MTDSAICAREGCDHEIAPPRRGVQKRFCSSACRAAAHRDIAMKGPGGIISSGPRKNKKGVSVTLQFTGDAAERVLKMNPKDSVHLVPTDQLPDDSEHTKGNTDV